MASDVKEPFLFLTGMPRSGTTLLEKLVSMHSEARILSQPFPLLYVEIKRAFWTSTGRPVSAVSTAYPLTDMLHAHYYPPVDLVTYLQNRPVTSSLFRRAMESMKDYDGQYTKGIGVRYVSSGLNDGHLFQLVDRNIKDSLADGPPKVYGEKETFCEEFIPFFLERGASVLMIIRDPRDVIASLNAGRGSDYSGRKKPHLFNIRCWRKSVAFALEYAGHPGFHMVLYEDLVTQPQIAMENVTGFLGLTPLASRVFQQNLKDGAGNIWASNSSHARTSRISTSSVGGYGRHLKAEEALFIEACCYPEMRILGYQTIMKPDVATDIMTEYVDDLPLERPELGDYVWGTGCRAEEMERINAAVKCNFNPAGFIFKKAFELICQNI